MKRIFFAKKQIGPLGIFLSALLAASTVGAILMSSVPPVSRDALTHHLAVPKLYLKHGLLADLPGIPFSYYPMNIDLLYYIPLIFGNDIWPKYIHMSFGLLTAVGIYGYLRNRIGLNYGLGGALLWLTTPIVLRLSTEIYVDLGLAFFNFAAIYQIIRWIETDFKYRHIALSGLFTGLALGTKYNALITLAVLSLLIPLIYARLRPRSDSLPKSCRPCAINTALDKDAFNKSFQALKFACFFVIVALVIFSPWMIRNMALKQNPIFPLMDQFFNGDVLGEKDDWSLTSSMVQQTGTTLYTRRVVFEESFAEIALIPIRIFFEGQDNDPRHFDGKLNPFLLIFLIAGIWRFSGKNIEKPVKNWIWFVFALLFFAITILSAPIRIRYLVPILPAIVILAMSGVQDLQLGIQQYKAKPLLFYGSKGLIVGAITLMFIYNSCYFIERFKKIEPIAYLSGEMTRSDYIADRIPEYRLVQFANKTLPHDARILCMFLGQRRYYFEKSVTFNEGILVQAIQRSESPADLAANLQKIPITHLIVRNDIFSKWLHISLTEEEIQKLSVFWRSHLHTLKADKGFTLYALSE